MIYVLLICLVVFLVFAIIAIIFIIRSSNKVNKNVDIHVSGGAEIDRGFVSSDNNYFKGLSGELEQTVVLGHSSRSGQPIGKTIIVTNYTLGKTYTVVLFPDIIIGRAAVDGVLTILNDSAVSKFHCRLYLKDDSTFIEDLNSSNHTFLNGAVVTVPTPIKSGDIIKIGNTQLGISM